MFEWVCARACSQPCNQDQITKAYQKRKSNQLLCYHNYLTQQNLWIIHTIHQDEQMFTRATNTLYSGLTRVSAKEKERGRVWQEENQIVRHSYCTWLGIGLKWISAVTVQCQSQAHSTINLCRKHHAMVSMCISISRFGAKTFLAKMRALLCSCWDHVIF